MKESQALAVAANSNQQWHPKTILVPIDFSDDSEKALRYAIGFAKRFNAEIILLHVTQSVDYYMGPLSAAAQEFDRDTKVSAEAELQRFIQQFALAISRVSYKLSAGNPSEEIISSAQDFHADLIVIATHGRRGLKHVLLGSVAEAVIRHSQCPVLVIRKAEREFLHEGAEGDGLALKRILVPVDFSECSELALTCGNSIANETGAELTLLHVAPIHYPVSEYGVMECPQLDAELREKSEKHLQELAAREARKVSQLRYDIRQGKAGVEIVNLADDQDMELIVMGTRGLSGLRHLLLGSTAEYVVRYASCPTLIVRSPEQQKQTQQGLASREALQEIANTHPFLRGIASDDLDIMLKEASIVEFQQGETIFREGGYADKFYLIHRGKVTLEAHTTEKEIPIQTIEAGDVLGWSWLFPPFSWHFQARALEQTTALQLNGAHILVASEKDDKLGHALMKRVVQIVIHRLQEARQKLIEAHKALELELGATF